MKVGIVGSRRRRCRDEVRRLVSSLPMDALVISGGCRGVDIWAVQCAADRGMRTEVYYPVKLGPGYGWACRSHAERNSRAADAVDVLHAFVAPDRKGGTEQTIGHALRAGKKVVIC